MVVIKNQLYQPVPITDNRGITYIMESRERKLFENLSIYSLPKSVQGLVLNGAIKVKEA